MASVIGRNSYVPGQRIYCEPGIECDHDGCPEDATVAIVGECDSIGSEVNHFCALHAADAAAACDEIQRHCQRCGSEDDVAFFRDPAEGFSGPVYEYCIVCRQATIEHLVGDAEEELESFIVDERDDDFPDDAVDELVELHAHEDD